MNKRILIERSGCRTRVAVTIKNDLIEYDEASPQAYVRAKNTIYNAVIKNIREELGAAFVQYTDDAGGKIKDGFLPFTNIANCYLKEVPAEQSEDISKRIKIGQKILVQIKKDQLHHESKGAALTTFISLAGTYLVLMPLKQKKGISRKAEPTQRQNVQEIIDSLNVSEDMGLIVRTAGISATKSEIEWDYKALLQQWKSIQIAHESLPAPYLIHEDENIVTRIVRDSMSSKTEKILTNNAAVFNEIKQYLENIRPEYIENNTLELFEQPMMFDHFSLNEQIEEIFHVKINLPSGGQVVMHGTEAGYMIDVNSSRSTHGSNIEENALNTNKQAAVKIADMLRLRDVSGIIHIDFIDMYEEENRKYIEKIFSERCALDRASVKHEPISILTGCMSVLRQGLGTVFFKSSLEPLTNDESIIIGKKRSVTSYANYMLSVLEKSASQKTDIVQVQLPVDIATYMLNEQRDALSSIEKTYDVVIKVLPNEFFNNRRYILKRFHKDEDNAQQTSYKAVSAPDDKKSWIAETENKEPHVKRQTARMNRQRKYNKKSTGIISGIWESIFGGEEKESGPKQGGRRPQGRGNRSRNTRKRQEDRSGNQEQRRNSRDRGNRIANQQVTTTQPPEQNFNRADMHEQETKTKDGNKRRGRSRRPRNSMNTQAEHTSVAKFSDSD